MNRQKRPYGRVPSVTAPPAVIRAAAPSARHAGCCQALTRGTDHLENIPSKAGTGNGCYYHPFPPAAFFRDGGEYQQRVNNFSPIAAAHEGGAPISDERSGYPVVPAPLTRSGWV